MLPRSVKVTKDKVTEQLSQAGEEGDLTGAMRGEGLQGGRSWATGDSNTVSPLVNTSVVSKIW